MDRIIREHTELDDGEVFAFYRTIMAEESQRFNDYEYEESDV